MKKPTASLMCVIPSSPTFTESCHSQLHPQPSKLGNLNLKCCSSFRTKDLSAPFNKQTRGPASREVEWAGERMAGVCRQAWHAWALSSPPPRSLWELGCSQGGGLRGWGWGAHVWDMHTLVFSCDQTRDEIHGQGLGVGAGSKKRGHLSGSPPAKVLNPVE